MPDIPDSTVQIPQEQLCAEICGFQVLTEPSQQAEERVIRTIEQGTGAWILTLNVYMLAEMYLDPDYARIMTEVNYATADGMPVVWASAWCMGPRIEGRTTGIELSRAILSSPRIERIALIGGANPTEITHRFRPGASRSYLVWDGQITFSEQRAEALVAELISHRTQIVLLALGIPKQDYFASFIKRHIPYITIIGIGGALDALLGLRPPTPRLLQNLGLEWLFRLGCEPRRLWKRYLLHYPYGVLLLIQALWLKRARYRS